MPRRPPAASRRSSRVGSAALTIAGKREQPRIPFGTLVERGVVPPGSLLMDRRGAGGDGRRRRHIRCGRAQGSIHQVGAAVQDAPSCNGWAFWHVELPGGRLRVLDEFRAEMLGRKG